MGIKVNLESGDVDVLVVALPSRLRDGLTAVIQALSWVGRVGAVAQRTAVSDYVQRYRPALVIFDVNDLELMTQVEAKILRASCQKTKCIVIIDRAQQRSMAQVMGAEAILLRGFSTELLYSTMRTLIVAYDPKVPVTGPLSELQSKSP